MSDELFQRVEACAVVPVVVIDDAAAAIGLARTLLDAGIDVIEVTLRTKGALAALEAVARDVPATLPIAGTVVSPDQVEQVRAAGARMIVSPGFTEQVAGAIAESGLAWLPGTATASDVMRVLAAGLTRAKFFPAEQAGGVPMLKAFASPFGAMRFCPTGGIGAHNALDYLSQPNVMAVGGSWFVPPKAVAAGLFDEIATLAAEAKALAHRARHGG